MTEAIKKVGGLFGGLKGAGDGTPPWMKAALAGLTGAGEVGNILADRKRGKLLSEEEKWASLTPQQLAAKIAAATQPLNAGLVQGVGNEVQANVAERGLAQAPGIFSGELAQVLAPFYQQNQNIALNAILRQMQLPVEASYLLPGSADLSPLLALLLRTMQKPTNSSTTPVDWGAATKATQPTFPDLSGIISSGGGLP